MNNKRQVNQIKLWHELAVLYLGGKCVECGATNKLHIHHKDDNPNNNEILNLELLCGKHHRKHHSVYPTVLQLKEVLTYEGGLPKLRCNRCGHSWIPRRNKPPKVCPKCKNIYWNKTYA